MLKDLTDYDDYIVVDKEQVEISADDECYDPEYQLDKVKLILEHNKQ